MPLATQSQPVTGNTEHTRPENRAFYPALDGLRAVAFLLVFFQHYIALPWGFTGVNIFFVLSGFLITGILFDTRDQPHRARNFYIRRSLRIFPLYYAVFLVLLLLEPWMHWQWTRWWLAWPLYLGNFLHISSPEALVYLAPRNLAANGWLLSPRLGNEGINLGHFWSLCVEEQFYLLWPWVVFRVSSRKTLLWICGSAVIITPLLRSIAYRTSPEWVRHSDLLHSFTPFTLDALLLGGLIGLLWRGPHRARLIVIAQILAAILSTAAILYLLYNFRQHPFDSTHPYFYPEWSMTWGLSVVNLLSAAAIVCILQPAGMLYRLLRIYPLRWMGRVSYSAYVLHDIFHNVFLVNGAYFYNRLCAHMITHYGDRFVAMRAYQTSVLVTVCLAATFLLAWLSFRFLESPFLNLKDRWTLHAGNNRSPSRASRAPQISLEG